MRLVLVPALVAVLCAPVHAQDAVPEEDDEAKKLEASLHFQTGKVVLGDNLATLNTPDSFRYINAEDTEKVLVAWGNPPGQKNLGMLFPAQVSPFADDGWGVVISYESEGHVDDEDAKEMDFDAMLKEMKESTEAENAEREKQGYGVVHLVRWAEPPHYDGATHKLYWAKELDFGTNPVHTLNYDIRVLGRKGVLEFSAVASIAQLALVKAESPKILSAVEFNQGSRYADFMPGVDTVAAYGVGALIAGKVAAKVGFFKLLIPMLLAGKKVVAAGVIALIAAAKAFFGRKNNDA